MRIVRWGWLHPTEPPPRRAASAIAPANARRLRRRPNPWAVSVTQPPCAAPWRRDPTPPLRPDCREPVSGVAMRYVALCPEIVELASCCWLPPRCPPDSRSVRSARRRASTSPLSRQSAGSAVADGCGSRVREVDKSRTSARPPARLWVEAPALKAIPRGRAARAAVAAAVEELGLGRVGQPGSVLGLGSGRQRLGHGWRRPPSAARDPDRPGPPCGSSSSISSELLGLRALSMRPLMKNAGVPLRRPRPSSMSLSMAAAYGFCARHPRTSPDRRRPRPRRRSACPLGAD